MKMTQLEQLTADAFARRLRQCIARTFTHADANQLILLASHHAHAARLAERGQPNRQPHASAN